jgi:GDP-L-fucose synthase
MHVDDAADGIKFLIDNDLSGELINISWGKDYKIKKIIDICKEIIGFKGEILWDSTKPDGMMKKLQDPERMRSLGWEPKISLEEGLKKTINWFFKERDSLRL